MTDLAVATELTISFPTGEAARLRVVDGMSLTVAEGESVGLVGESGAGKTLTALALARLLPTGASVDRGAVFLAGEDVLTASDARLRELRGASIGYVFQEPSQALNPVRKIWYQVSEAARLHSGVSGAPARQLAVRLLREVGLEEPEELARAYPHQLSGGQRQRVLLACALAGEPSLVVADEPTSALDSVSQAHLIALLQDLIARRAAALLFITHDLALVGRLVDRVVVAYAGETIEDSPRDALLQEPLHPYTRALLALGRNERRSEDRRFATVPGAPPQPARWGSGCRFAPRCPRVFEPCMRARPALADVGGGRRVRCFLHSSEATRE
jgi:peptide/nickel transport system ATP-binding protein